ncbi:MAG: hypothetical protein RLZZ292_3029 [Bacteroidota bacterium]|jgi:hypothetical protein
MYFIFFIFTKYGINIEYIKLIICDFISYYYTRIFGLGKSTIFLFEQQILN